MKLPMTNAPPGKQVMNNQRFTKLLKEHLVFEEPQHVDADSICVDYMNRKGQPPDVQYIHRSLQPKIASQGYYEKRPKPGFLRVLKNPETRAKCMAFNKHIAEGSEGVYPPLCEAMIKYSCLGGNHLTIVFKGSKANMLSSISGAVWSINPNDDQFVNVCRQGHKYYILDERLSNEDAEWLAESQNADNNENAGNNDGMNYRAVMLIHNQIEAESKNKQVKTSDVIARFQKGSVSVMNAGVISAYHKYVSAQGSGAVVIELCDWVSENVDFTDLTMPTGWLEDSVKILPRDKVFVRLVTTKLQYLGGPGKEGRIVHQRPTPDSARYILPAEMTSLVGNSTVLELWDEFLAHVRNVVEPALSTLVNPKRARNICSGLELWSGRLAYCKTYVPDEYVPKLSGKMTREKLDQNLRSWAIAVESKLKLGGFIAAIGITPDSDKVEDEQVSLRRP